jgi:NodT family efflux transporter outer membrane factor (OMF) lipoprotein
MVPKEFVGQVSDSALQIWPAVDWWQNFGSTELSELITTAGVENRDIVAATARLAQARARLTVERSALLPRFDAQLQKNRTGTQSTGGSSNSVGLNASVNYDLDIWGFQYNKQHAVFEALKSSKFARQAAALAITTDVANAYFNLLALRERIALAKEDIDAVDGILDTIKLKVSAGVSSRLDLAQETAQIESLRGQLVSLEQLELQARIALAILIGRPPQMFEIKAQELGAISAPLIQPGLPSELLLRRPDIAQAEADLASAHASVDAARAALLPRFPLTGTGGYISTSFQALRSGSTFVWDAGASLIQTIFAGGALVGQKRIAQETQREFIAIYQGTVLNAFGDVENALGEVNYYSRAKDHLRKEVDAAREAFEIAQLQYRQGTADLFNVLQTQLTLFAAKDELTRMTLLYLQATVHLYTALGGGWILDPAVRTQLPAAQSVTNR